MKRHSIKFERRRRYVPLEVPTRSGECLYNDANVGRYNRYVCIRYNIIRY